MFVYVIICMGFPDPSITAARALHEQARQAFFALCDLSVEEQQARLAEACDHDLSLMEDVADLLLADRASHQEDWD